MNNRTAPEYIPGQNLATPETHRVYYTPQALSDMWQCNICTIYDLLRQGKLIGFKLGRDWRIAESAVLAYEQDPENQSAMVYKTGTQGKPAAATFVRVV